MTVNHNDAAVLPSAARYSFHRELMADARFYRSLVTVGAKGPRSLAWTMLCSRGLWLLTFHRIGHYCSRRRGIRNPRWWFMRLCRSFGTCFGIVLCRSQVSSDCEICSSVYLSNQGYIFCGARSIGTGSLIHDRCTFGYTVADGGEGRPVIGKNVWVGPNCIIAGSLTIGDGATILPNSFLTSSVPPGAVVKGNPAVLVRIDFDNLALRQSLAVVHDVAANVP
jgi:serine acetyltransferase